MARSRNNTNTLKKTEPETTQTEEENTTPETQGTEEATQEVQAEAETQPEIQAEPEPEQNSEPETTQTEEVSKKGVSETLARTLNNYVKAMNPVNPISVSDGVREQKRLRGAIINAIVEADDDVAMANIRYILDFIHADTTGCFEMTKVFRFYDSNQWTVPGDRKEMETLMTLFMATAKPSTRGKEARRLDWTAMATQIAPERAGVIMDRLRRTYGIE